MNYSAQGAHGGTDQSVIQRFIERAEARERSLSRSNPEKNPFTKFTAPTNVVALRETVPAVISSADKPAVTSTPEKIPAQVTVVPLKNDPPVPLVVTVPNKDDSVSSEVTSVHVSDNNIPIDPVSAVPEAADNSGGATPPRTVSHENVTESLENTPTGSTSSQVMDTH